MLVIKAVFLLLLQTDEELLGRALSAMSRLGENERMLSDPTWFRRSEDHERAIMELPGN